MSEKRIRRPARGGQKGSAAGAATPAPEAGGFDWSSHLEAIFNAAYDEESARRSDELLECLANAPFLRGGARFGDAEEPAKQRPKAQIIPFPKARE